MSLLKEAVERWRMPTPAFWKKVQRFGMKMCGVGIVMAVVVPYGTNWFIDQVSPYKEGITFVFYDWYYSGSVYIFVSGLIIAGLSKLAITNNVSEWLKPPIDLKGKDSQSDNQQE